MIPLVWVLMERQTEEAYRAVLELVRRLLHDYDIAFELVITDFERAQQNAWRDVFDINIQGCLWHLVRVSMLGN